ncbi:MAG TPA: helix-turn-helix transcriptional regulator [Streptosporangiaceae bacterium]|nr:helix-turn-helix transcriptional regulator [Streptosporangiaceae bacterium]
MADGPNPVVQRRRLRAELRSARQAAKLTQETVAQAMDWSPSKIIRIEAGSTGISTNDLKALLQLYKIDDPIRADELLSLARAAKERSWWSDYKDEVSPRFFQFIEHEAAASGMQSFQPLMVPGLFQTREYAKTVIAQFAPSASDKRLDTLLNIRIRRQEVLNRTNSPLMHFVLNEAAIRAEVGGKQIMHRQLLHLIDLADRPDLTLEIIPFTAGLHPGMQAPFIILELADGADDDVLFLEQPRGDLIFADDLDETSTYRETFEQLRKLSLGPEQSAAYLATIASEMA